MLSLNKLSLIHLFNQFRIFPKYDILPKYNTKKDFYLILGNNKKYKNKSCGLSNFKKPPCDSKC